MHTDLTQGSVTRSMLGFAWPLILGNLLQQLYNVADTLIVGRFLGAGALAAVGSSFTLMTFLTSVLLGLCMGSGAVFSLLWGARKEEELKASLFVSFLLVGAATLAVAALAQRLGIGPESVMALGDYDNDVSMLSYAGVSVAMANASERARAAARYRTLSNDEDGVAHAIQRYALAQALDCQGMEK